MTIESSVDQTLKTKQRKELNKVFESYFYWFLGVAILAAFASFMAYLINLHLQLAPWLIRFIQVSSLVIEAVALGQGVSGKTWGGISSAEIWDERLHNIFSISGFILIVFSFQLYS